MFHYAVDLPPSLSKGLDNDGDDNDNCNDDCSEDEMTRFTI